MSPPIFTPDGSEVSEIVLPDGSTASEVIGPDGNVVFEAGPDIPDSVIDNYELESADPPGVYGAGETLSDYYGGDLSVFDIQTSTVLEGARSASASGSTSTNVISSTSGLNRYLEQGETLSALLRSTDDGGGGTGLAIATQSETGLSNIEGYQIQIAFFNDTLRILRFEGDGTATELASPSVSWNANTTYRVEIAFGTDNSLQATAFDLSDQQLGQTQSITDQTYTSGGIGLVHNGNTTSDTSFFDGLKVV